jgi:nitrate reductase gamma subunit
MRVFLALLTYFSYFFIVFMYTLKIVEYLKMPLHLRWELYPVIPEERFKYGGSYMEEPLFWEKKRRRSLLRGLLFLLKDYFVLSEYFKRKRSYWLSLYPWHVGFITIILFHISCFFSGLLMLLGFRLSPSSSLVGSAFYYTTVSLGLLSFLTGLFGSVGILIKRLEDADLRLYAAPMNFLTYVFTILVFSSGLYAFFLDPSLEEYRHFWEGLLSLRFVDVSRETAIHIILFSLFLIYLPFTRSIHYITRILGFFLIRWDDRPNKRGGEIEGLLERELERKVDWAAPHVKRGVSWKENALSL